MRRAALGWGPQALFDLRLLRSLLQHVSHVVPELLVPRLIALDGDEAAVRARYAEIWRGLAVPGRLASPRARWAYEYGSFVREVEWVTAELSKHMSEAQLERLVIDEMAKGIAVWSKPMKEGFQTLLSSVGSGGGAQSAMVERAETYLGPRVGKLMFEAFNAASFLVGPVHVVSFDAHAGEVELHIPECAFHTVAETGKPQTRGCLWVCKGACERVFDQASGLQLTLEPELPALGCRMRLRWNAQGA